MVHDNLIHYGTKAERDSHIHTLAKNKYHKHFIKSIPTLWGLCLCCECRQRAAAVSPSSAIHHCMLYLHYQSGWEPYYSSLPLCSLHHLLPSCVTTRSSSLVLLSNSATSLSFQHLLSQSQTVPCPPPPNFSLNQPLYFSLETNVTDWNSRQIKRRTF